MHLLIFQNNHKAMMDLENTKQVPNIGGGVIKHIIVPIYALWIFSFSKIILMFIPNKIYDFDFITFTEVSYIWMWISIFIASSIFWLNHNKKAEKKWDLKLTIIVLFITSVQLFWNSFYLPLAKGVIEITECIGDEIVKEKIIDNKIDLNNSIIISLY